MLGRTVNASHSVNRVRPYKTMRGNRAAEIAVICGHCGDVLHVSAHQIAVGATLACKSCSAPYHVGPGSFGMTAQRAIGAAAQATRAEGAYSEFPPA